MHKMVGRFKYRREDKSFLFCQFYQTLNVLTITHLDILAEPL